MGSHRISHFHKLCRRLVCRFYSTEGVLPPAAFIKNYCTKGSIKKKDQNKFIGKTKATMHCVFMLLKGFLTWECLYPLKAPLHAQAEKQVD